ncbi:MAG: UDP-glucose 4-epimerase GalE [Spirochaetota bacterium]|nr:UDP-glucose 4-epimerase GalE [Spirochaetota bacterium]
MDVLITGGAGYIGSHVVKLLGETGDFNITTVDNLSTGKRSAILFGEFIEADLSDFSLIEKIIQERRFDAIIHFAASIVVPESVENPLKYYLNNTVNTINLINLCNKYGIKDFIFSSTAAVYGNPREIPVRENEPLCPISPYGTSKMMIEQVLIDSAMANLNFQYAILRYFNVAGADVKGRIGQSFDNATHLIKVAAQTVLGAREKIDIFGDDYDTPDGTGIRDYIHVDDLAMAHLIALEYLQSNDSDIFNCGYGHGFSVKEVIETMKEVSKIDFRVDLAPRRAGDAAILISDNSKIVEKLKFKPQYDDIELICKTALEWERKCI